MAEDPQITLVAPDEGRAYWLVGDLVRFKTTGAQTGGAFTAFENVTPPGGGPPPHVHTREDEAFLVLEGQYEFLVGERTLRATTGSFISAPRGIPHTFKNVGSAPGRLLVIVSPPSFDGFVAEAGEPAGDPAWPPPPPGQAEIDRLMAACRKYEIEILTPAEG